MSIVVQKYGGSSVADVERLRKVAARVVATRRAGHDVVVVVSAMGKTTDGLLELARQVSPEPGRRELDMLVSVGERISMALLSMAISDLGLPAISFTGSQSGIITDTSHFSARVLEVRPHRIQRALQEGKIVIVAGYQGVSVEKEVTTLGRGGSDTTAIALAAALEAEYCEICSDVDGVYTADPRVVPEAHRIDELSVEEMLTLARSGAKVLAAEAVAYARKAGVTIRASASFQDTGHTVVGALTRRRGPVAVTADPSVLFFEWRGGLMRLPDLTRWLSEMGVAPVQLQARGEGARGWFRTANLPDLGRVRSEAQLRWGEELEFQGGDLTVTLVGEGLAEEGLGLSTALHALHSAGLSVHAVSAQATCWTFEMPRGQEAPAQQALHRQFLEGKNA